MEPTNLIINLNEIYFAYPAMEPILKNFNLKLYKGQRLGVTGQNGSGKTTIFHIIMGLLKASSGDMEFFGKLIHEEKDFQEIRQKIGLLFQDSDDQLFSPTVLEDVAFGPLNLGKSKKEAIDISKKTLKRLGLQGFEDRITYKLSGGEKRLVSLATVLAMKPDVLLLDEPTTGLDDKTKESLIQLLGDLDQSYIIISHDFNFLSRTTSSISLMEKGQLFMDKDFHIHQHYHSHRHGTYPHKHN